MNLLRSSVRTLAIIGSACMLASTAHAQFQKDYGNSFTFSDVSQSVRSTIDGGHITAGYATYFGGRLNAILSKTDASGNLQWTQSLHRDPIRDSEYDAAFAVREVTSRGSADGYIVAGVTRETGTNDILIVRTDVLGNTTWRKAYYSTSGEDVAYNIEVIYTSDNMYVDHYIVTGYVDANLSTQRGQRIFLMKIDPAGNMVWIRRFGLTHANPSLFEQNVGFAVQPVPADGGYILTGYTNENGYLYNKVPIVIRTNSSGNLLWGYTYPGPANAYPFNNERYGVGTSIRQSSEGGFIIAGTMNTYTVTSKDAFLLKIDDSGNRTWMYTYDARDVSNNTSFTDWGFDVYQKSNGNYVLAGSSDYTTTVSANQHLFYLEVARARPDAAVMTWQYLYRIVRSQSILSGIDAETGISMHPTANGYIIEGDATDFYLVRTNIMGGSNGCERSIPLFSTLQTPTGVEIPQHQGSADELWIQYLDLEHPFTMTACGDNFIKHNAAPNLVVAPQDESRMLSIQPNAVRVGDPLNVTYAGASAGSRIRVLDLSGRMIQDAPITTVNGQTTIATTGWSSGTYFVEILADAKPVRRTVLVVQ